MALDVSGSNSLFWRTGINNQGLMTGAAQAKGILGTLARNITGMDIFAGLGVSAAIVFAKMARQAYTFSKEFETSMREVQTISKATQDNFEGISQEIINMSKTVPDNALKLTKALYQIVSAGYDGAKAMDILKVSSHLAVATLADTFNAADALTYVMNAYGEAAGTASEISSKLFTIVKLGKVRMEELAPSISMVTGLAAQVGMSFNELAAIYAESVKKLKPDIATTGIRGIITAMLQVSKGTGEAADTARELGIEFDISALKSKGFKQILLDIIEATKGNEAALGRLFPNVRGLTGLLSIMTGEGEAFSKTLNEIENSLGATDKAFATMMDTTTNQLAILHNNFMAKLKPLGDSLLGFMNDIAKSINIAMSGANDELSKLSRSYSELTNTLQRKQNRIDSLIAIVEDLRSKTELTREETTQLKAAEEALAIYFPILGKAAEFAGASIDVLTLAKQGTYDLSVRIMELELAQAKIEMRRADLAKELYDLNEDKGQKEINRINKQIKAEEDLQKFILTGGEYELYEQQLLDDMMKVRLKDNKEYLELEKKLAYATEQRRLEEEQLIINQEKAYIEVDALTEALKELKETREKPVSIPVTAIGETPKTTISIAVNVEEVNKQLKDMASRYKLYLSDLTEHKKEWIQENNAQLVIDAENYGQYLSDMREKYKGNAELLKTIDADIYEYNKTIEEKRKKLEDDLYKYIAEAREKDLKAEEDNFEAIIKNYERGTTEYLSAVEKHNKNVLEINNKYNKEMADAALTIFKKGLEKQTGELDEHYKQRLEVAKTELYKETEFNKEYYEFVTTELNKLAEVKEEKAKEDQATLDSYFQSYQTTEEKIISIHKKTADLLELTDKEYEKDKLKSIEKQLITEIEASEAMKEVNEKLAEYKGTLNNEELENKIATLEEMKVKYAEYADIIIILNEAIVESENQIWENVRSEIDSTASALHSLADIVGNFDTELESMINNLANLVSGVGAIVSGFAMGGIGGIAGALGGIATVISSIINLFVQHKTEVPELEEELHKITLELQAQQNILNQATGVAETEAIKDRIALLKEQIATYNDLIAAEEAAYGQFLWWTWDETDQAAIEGWLSSIEGVNAEIASLNQQYKEILTGTTAESIADAIAEGFKQGLTSAEVFANSFNEMMSNAIIDAFKRTIITKYIEEWYNQFAALSEGGLTAEELETLMNTLKIAIEAAGQDWEKIVDLASQLDIDLFNIEEIQDALNEVAGITEETIADAITEGFSQGLDSAELFTETFNDMMKKAILDAFKQTIMTAYIKQWMEQFYLLAAGGLSVEELLALEISFKKLMEDAAVEWAQIVELAKQAGIDLFGEINVPKIHASTQKAMKEVAGITEETIADAIAKGFESGLDSAGVFADTFNDMIRKAITDAFKQNIINAYTKKWMNQFYALSKGGLTVGEIETLMGTFKTVIEASGVQWEAMQTILDTAGIELEKAKSTGLTGAIAGITEETAGLLAGQFQAIRINTVSILSNMENIIIINSRIADNTEYNRYLEHISAKLDEMSSSSLRAIGG